MEGWAPCTYLCLHGVTDTRNLETVHYYSMVHIARRVRVGTASAAACISKERTASVGTVCVSVD